MQSLSPYLLVCLFVGSLFAACSPNPEKSTEAEPEQEEPSKIELLVGTYTGKGSEGIYRFDFDPTTGMLSEQKLVAKTVSPSYLTMSKDRQYVFAVNESEKGHVSSFKWNADRSELEAVSQQSSQGDYPCYVELNPAENRLAIGNYITGNTLIFSVNEAGAIGETPTVYQHKGSGPVSPNQGSAHAHCVKFDANGKFLYAVDLGADQIISYPIDENSKVGSATTRLAADPGDGPRHLIFHPTQDLAFVVNELSSSVVSLRLDSENGTFTPLDRASTLPDDFTGKSYCADIHLSVNGKFLYASNRGHNSIAIFTVSEKGDLNRIGVESIKGDWPRNFALSPDNRYVLVANQKSDNITVFEVNPETGLLTFTGHEVSISQPVVMKF